MPNYNIPVNSALEELGITKTKKAIVDLDAGTFSDDETFSFSKGEETTKLEIDPDFGRVKLAGLFGIGKGYAKKMPWNLFVQNIQYWANEGRVLLEWSEQEDSELGILSRAVSAEKTILTRDNLLSEYLGNLHYLYRLRWLAVDKDTIYIDIELSDENESLDGIRLVADLSLKSGIKLYSLLNVSQETGTGEDQRLLWSPVVVSEAKKVRTRGKDALEVYEAIRTDVETLAEDMKSTDLGAKMLAGILEEHFHYDYHAKDCLTSLIGSKTYKVGTKTINSKFPSDTGHDFQVGAFVRQGVATDWNFYKPAEVHNYQTFFGDVVRIPSMVKTCSFCYSKLDEEEEV